MSRKAKGGWIWKLPLDERRKTIAMAVAQSDGMLVRAAHRLGIARSHIYRLVAQLELWPVVNRARAQRIANREADKLHDRQSYAWTVPPRYKRIKRRG